MIRIAGLIFIMALPVFFFCIAGLRKLKGVQQIYALSPNTHQQKTGTVSFGGIPIITMSWIGAWIAGLLGVPEVLFVLLGMGIFGLIGLIDDLLSVQKKQNKGLSVRQKLALQIGACILLLSSGPFFGISIPWYVWPLYIFIGTGTTNATNLTDGLDGLLTGLSLLTMTGFFIAFGNNPMLQNLCLIIMAVLSAFLVFNRNPAHIFMGDTGSLALGGLFFSASVWLQNPWILIPLGGVYIMEVLSVITQVFWFKRTGKRIFKMSPLHHHFELLGLSEKQVVWLFWGIGAVFLCIWIIGQ